MKRFGVVPGIEQVLSECGVTDKYYITVGTFFFKNGISKLGVDNKALNVQMERTRDI